MFSSSTASFQKMFVDFFSCFFAMCGISYPPWKMKVASKSPDFSLYIYDRTGNKYTKVLPSTNL